MPNFFKKLDRGASRFFSKVENGGNKFFTKTVPNIVQKADGVVNAVAGGVQRATNTLEKLAPLAEAGTAVVAPEALPFVSGALQKAQSVGNSANSLAKNLQNTFSAK
jgi:hypothetical protein